MPSVTFGQTVQLSLTVRDNIVATNNPVVGLSCWAAIRDMATDKWWNFTTETFDDVEFDDLTSDHKLTLEDMKDGSYEEEWNQALTGQTSGSPAWYRVYFCITSEGYYYNKTSDEVWTFSSDPDATGTGSLVAQIMVVDEDGEGVAGAYVSVYSEDLLLLKAYAPTNDEGKVIFNLDADTYKVTVSTQGRYSTDSPYTYVFDGGTDWTELEVHPVTTVTPENPDYCRVYATLVDSGGTPLVADEGSIRVTQVYYSPDGFGGVTLPGGASGATDDQGYAYIDIARGATVGIEASWGQGSSYKDSINITVPVDAPSYDISSLLTVPAGS